MAAPGGDHVGQDCPGKGQRAEVVDLHHRAVHRFHGVDEPAALADPAAVDHKVHPADCIPRLINQVCEAIRRGEVEGDDEHVLSAEFSAQGGENLVAAR